MKTPKIEFVSYDGEYPCLCFGHLILKIDGEIFEFGDDNYPKFWTSGGSVSFDEDWNEEVLPGDWDWLCMDEDKMPEVVMENKERIMEIFNENVPPGCCGGCV